MTTQAEIRVALPETGRGIWRDDTVPGLELRGNQSGGVWTVRHRVDGRRVRDTIGRWPGLDVAGARRAARAMIEQSALRKAAGLDALAERRVRQAAAARRRAAISFDKAVTLYAEAVLAARRSGTHAEGVIRLVFASVLDRSLVDLTREELVRCLEAKRKTAPATADTAIRYARPLFAWIAQTGRGDDLLAGVKAPQTRKRERTLSLRETGQVLLALEAMGPHPGALTARFIVATAARRDEAGGLRWSEIDLDAKVWTLPALRNKSAREHRIPLSAEAVAVLEAAKAAYPGGAEDLAFPGAARTAFQAWSKLKRRADTASGVKGWTWHDLRRTFATVLADRGIAAHVADRCLNHAGAGTATTVARIYQRSELWEQRKAAMDTWAAALTDARVMASAANVVPIADKRTAS